MAGTRDAAFVGITEERAPNHGRGRGRGWQWAMDLSNTVIINDGENDFSQGPS